jgi:hypothetical protein
LDKRRTPHVRAMYKSCPRSGQGSTPLYQSCLPLPLASNASPCFAYTLYWMRETDRKLSENPVLAARAGETAVRLRRGYGIVVAASDWEAELAAPDRSHPPGPGQVQALVPDTAALSYQTSTGPLGTGMCP